PYNGVWYTSALGSGQTVKAGTKLYVDTGYHYLYYVGNDTHLWVWYVNGSGWVNAPLNNTDVATDLVGVDSSLHWLWFRNSGALSPLYVNGSAWVSAASGVTDYDGTYGGAV